MTADISSADNGEGYFENLNTPSLIFKPREIIECSEQCCLRACVN